MIVVIDEAPVSMLREHVVFPVLGEADDVVNGIRGPGPFVAVPERPHIHEIVEFQILLDTLPQKVR